MDTATMSMLSGGVILLLKLTLWCALPFALRPLLARAPASIRHLLLTLTLAGTIAMPLLLVAAPQWQAPAWLQLPELALTPDVAVPEPVLAAPPHLFARREGASPFMERGTLGDVGRRLPRGRVSDRTSGGVTAASPPAEALRTPAGPVSAMSSGQRLSWLGWIWLFGAAVGVLRTAFAALRASQVVRDATPIEDPRAAAALARARARLRLTLEPELRQSRRFPMPFAWRGLKSAVVLPPTWRRWDDERLTVVLVHELAHLRRRDAPALWIGRAATALWWFHPLVRMLEGWAREECEQAADDAVLLSGSRASEYAEHLIAISRALTRPFPEGVALMMSNSPDLKHRLLAILRADQPRHALTRRLAAGSSLLALACAVALAGARLVPTVHAQEEQPDVEVEVQDDGGGHGAGHHHIRQHVRQHVRHQHDGSGSGAGHDAWEKASEAHDQGRYDEAIAAFEAAAAAGFRPAVSTYNAACGMALTGRNDEALDALGQAVKLGFDAPELLAEDSDLDSLRADARFQTLVDEVFELAGERRDPIEHHRYRSAHEALEVLRESGSEDSDAWAKVGTQMLMLREFDAATEALENAARFAREAPVNALYNLACAHALDGRSGDALAALERSIEAGYSAPNHMREDPDLRSLRGDGEFERLVALAEALDLGRFQRDYWHDHGKGKHKDKQGHGDRRYSAEMWTPAIDFYRGFVDEHPSLGAGWFNLAYALHYSKRFDESVDAFRRARELGFRPATSIYNVACAYSMQNRIDDALAALEEAIALGQIGHDLDHDSDLENLRQDPRFRSLRLKMKLERHG